jgi:hypothetical protein
MSSQLRRVEDVGSYQTRMLPRAQSARNRNPGCSFCGAIWHKANRCPELNLGIDGSPNDWRHHLRRQPWSPWMLANWWSVGTPEGYDPLNGAENAKKAEEIPAFMLMRGGGV